MTSIQMTLTLPDKLAQRAKAANLLTPTAIASLIEQELQRQNQVEQLFFDMERLADADLPPLTEAEIEAEISAARHARRS